MEDRILINGVWYVKESEKVTDIEFTAKDVTHFEGCVYETDDYCWEANTLDSADLAIEFTNKKTKQTEYWDNPTWLHGLYHNEPTALKAAKERMDERGIKEFKAFLVYLMEYGWL